MILFWYWIVNSSEFHNVAGAVGGIHANLPVIRVQFSIVKYNYSTWLDLKYLYKELLPILILKTKSLNCNFSMAGAYILKSNIVCHFVEESNNFEDMICFNFQCHLIKLSQGNGTKFVRPNIFNICNGYMERNTYYFLWSNY